MTPNAICGLLAEPERLAAFSAVVLGVGTTEEIANRTGLGRREVVSALRRLSAGGLVYPVEGRWRAEATAFKVAVRETAAPPDDHLRDLDILLEHVVTVFEPGVRYPEREVDALLRAWHDDYVTVRRYLVDERLLSREAGIYWRTGGPYVPQP